MSETRTPVHGSTMIITFGQPLSFPGSPLPAPGKALALAPHPDDPDAVAVMLLALQRGGWQVHWVILNSGWSGVEEDFVGPERAAKGRAREAEERAAARLFGLPEERLTFLHLAENHRGEMRDREANYLRFSAFLQTCAPDLVLLPHGDDTNPDHRLTFTWFRRWAGTWPYPVLGIGNEDPKTVAFQPDLVLIFDEEIAAWKAAVLECHRSQSVRNQHTRGHTFAERILAVNRRGMPAGLYAERFQLIKEQS